MIITLLPAIAPPHPPNSDRPLTSTKSDRPLTFSKSDRPPTSQKAIALPYSQQAIALPHPQKAIAKADTYYYLNSKASHDISGNI